MCRDKLAANHTAGDQRELAQPAPGFRTSRRVLGGTVGPEPASPLRAQEAGGQAGAPQAGSWCLHFLRVHLLASVSLPPSGRRFWAAHARYIYLCDKYKNNPGNVRK